MKERRKHRRIADKLFVSYRTVKEGNFSQEITEDIGIGGIRLLMAHSLPQDSIIDLEIRLSPDNTIIHTIGKVIWSQPKQDSVYPYMVGIQFISIDPAEREKLQQYLTAKECPGSNVEWWEGKC